MLNAVLGALILLQASPSFATAETPRSVCDALQAQFSLEKLDYSEANESFTDGCSTQTIKCTFPVRGDSDADQIKAFLVSEDRWKRWEKSCSALNLEPRFMRGHTSFVGSGFPLYILMCHKESNCN